MPTGKPIKRRKSEDIETPIVKRRRIPGRTIESREDQIIRLAYDEAERRIKAKTATSQELTHFLKQGSTLALLEKAKLEKENQLLQAKTEAILSQKRVEELYANAMRAFGEYRGETYKDEDEDGD